MSDMSKFFVLDLLFFFEFFISLIYKPCIKFFLLFFPKSLGIYSTIKKTLSLFESLLRPLSQCVDEFVADLRVARLVD